MYDEYENSDMKAYYHYEYPNQPLPQYAEVYGQKIFMGGLDYSLLQKQKYYEKKIGLLGNIKNQLLNIEKKIDSRTVKIDPSKPKIDEYSIKLIQSIKNLQNIKPLVNNSTFYLFDTKYHFGKLTPEVITKRLGRMNKYATYMKVNPEKIMKFKRLLEKPNFDTEKIKKDKAIQKLLGNYNDYSSDSSSDNIFGSDSEENGKYHKKEEKLFNFGQKLSLGVSDSDIFSQKRTVNIAYKNNEQIDEQYSVPEYKDKYEFMRKKVKKVTTYYEFDGYGECYFQSGPTFYQMKYYREQGIYIWGDLKYNKKVYRKQNINREYDMVKKIIDEKSKKK